MTARPAEGANEPLAGLDQLPVGVFVGPVGADTGVWFCNRALKSLLGGDPDAPHTGVNPFDPERFADPGSREALLGQLETAGSVVDYPIRLRRNDGSLVWVELSATPGGAVLRDVNARRVTEEQSRDLHHALAQAEKLAALGQTVSGVAHELNNPLATILAWAERLAEAPADEKTRRGLDVILKEAERAARIVRNLLTFARKRQTTRAMIDVNDIVRDTLAMRSEEHRVRSVNVRRSLSGTLPPVFADSYQIKQILLNLVINAEHAMADRQGGGTLHVRTWQDEERESVVIEVNDDGPGMSEDVQAKVFDPFFTTKDVGQGTGLGLSVAFGIVQEHGGRLWVTSTPGHGASFFVELPVSGESRSARTAATAPPLPAPGTFVGRAALVVEDEPALASAVAEALTDAGFSVDRAGDGEQGLLRVTQRDYDLIVCDLKMPRIDGMQFYRAIAAATPTLARRVIFVTGAVAGTEAERFFAETGCRWLAKPFRLGDLLRAAAEALA